MERRFAALLIADVVGYVRLSQADELGKRARFQATLTRFSSQPSPPIAVRGVLIIAAPRKKCLFWQKWQRLRRDVRSRISRSNGSQTARLGAVWHIVLTPVT
jgi:hypothetical protein